MPAIPVSDFNAPAIRRHFAKVDPVMARLLIANGPCAILRPERGGSPYEALGSAIIHQQLHGKAAATILGRVKALAGGDGKRFPTPAGLGTLSDAALRGAGLSGNKLLALRDLAAKALDGTLPSTRAIVHLPDEEIIARCTAVRGVGRWTVEMLLIFRLGRPDVLPVDDFGVRNGYRLAYARAGMPTPKELARIGEMWAPWRSVAAWYLWRAADAEKVARIQSKKS